MVDPKPRLTTSFPWALISGLLGLAMKRKKKSRDQTREEPGISVVNLSFSFRTLSIFFFIRGLQIILAAIGGKKMERERKRNKKG